MSSHKTNPEQDPVQEQLVAYLDGELDAETSAQVERRLAEDAEYRVQLNQLQQTWDLLDHLPRGKTNDTFTQSTVEMVAVAATGDQTVGVAGMRKHRWWLASGMVVLLTVAAVSGYWLVHSTLAQPNRQLVRDLPIIEDLDMYRNMDSIEFLVRLADEGLFDEGFVDEP